VKAILSALGSLEATGYKRHIRFRDGHTSKDIGNADASERCEYGAHAAPSKGRRTVNLAFARASKPVHGGGPSGLLVKQWSTLSLLVGMILKVVPQPFSELQPPLPPSGGPSSCAANKRSLVEARRLELLTLTLPA
jgi:hypothetical protein